jgi:hypothetical protein
MSLFTPYPAGVRPIAVHDDPNPGVGAPGKEYRTSGCSVVRLG